MVKNKKVLEFTLSKKSTRYGLWIGPNYNGKGGVCSVIKTYHNEGLFSGNNIKFLPTAQDGTKRKKLIVFLKAFYYFLKKIRRVKFIHVHLSSDASFWRKSIFVVIAHFYKIPVIIHLHASGFVNFYSNAGNTKKHFIKSVFSKANLIFVLSNDMEMFVQGLLLKVETHLFPNPVVIAPAQYDLKIKNNKILFLGRIIKEKGIEELLSAINLVVQEIPNLQLIIGGDGNMDMLYSLIDKYKLKNNVVIKGWMNDEEKKILMNESSILVLPSYNEGQSVAILEAMSSYLPVIATAVGGNTFLIDNFKTGILIPVRNSEALADAILKVIQNNVLQKELAIAARKQVEGKFDSKVILKRMLDIYSCYN